ncbi:hypothetical protein N8E89_28610 (plasmid) [Phyllobacterium sp. A18/5-2]|nr:hypothetical protein [Phyllobacterium sp. A18/5-2]UXN67727.1 hypothetical protein N8E89_28610 [Phyllobacterium sp. A18/5-2]
MPILLFMNISASHPATPPMMIAAIHPAHFVALNLTATIDSRLGG